MSLPACSSRKYRDLRPNSDRTKGYDQAVLAITDGVASRFAIVAPVVGTPIDPISQGDALVTTGPWMSVQRTPRNLALLTPSQFERNNTMTQIDASLSGKFTIGGDITVNRLGFGAMRLTGPDIWGEPEDRSEALRVLKRLPEIGVNFIDTADSYGPFVSEELIAEALHPYNGALIATKGGLVRPGVTQGEWPRVGDPNYLGQCVRMSLRRLKIDRIDLWQLHRIDGKVPQNEQFGVIREFIDRGFIRHAGLSQVAVEQIEAARKFFPVATVQNRYNLTDRADEAVLNYCEANGIGFIPWYPLAAGDLARPGGVVDTLAKSKGATRGQIALAWMLKRSPAMLPIPGTSRVAHLEENVAGVAVVLTDEEFAELDVASPAYPTTDRAAAE
jgi:aryl-alcohol dehydrogenase-like predicted oxidoreductase